MASPLTTIPTPQPEMASPSIATPSPSPQTQPQPPLKTTLQTTCLNPHLPLLDPLFPSLPQEIEAQLLGHKPWRKRCVRKHAKEQEALASQNLPHCIGCPLCILEEIRLQKLQEKKDREAIVPIRQDTERSRKVAAWTYDAEVPARMVRTFMTNLLFQGTVDMLPREEAKKQAMSERTFDYDPTRLVFWTDGGKSGQNGGIGVVFVARTDRWVDLSWHVPLDLGDTTLELYAISKAIEIARDECRGRGKEERPKSVIVYSDAMGALSHYEKFKKSQRALRKMPYGAQIIGRGVVAADQLHSLDVKIQLRWVPAHSAIPGNTHADRAARKGAKTGTKRYKGKVLIPVAPKEALKRWTEPAPWKVNKDSIVT